MTRAFYTVFFSAQGISIRPNSYRGVRSVKYRRLIRTPSWQPSSYYDGSHLTPDLNL